MDEEKKSERAYGAFGKMVLVLGAVAGIGYAGALFQKRADSVKLEEAAVQVTQYQNEVASKNKEIEARILQADVLETRVTGFRSELEKTTQQMVAYESQLNQTVEELAACNANLDSANKEIGAYKVKIQQMSGVMAQVKEKVLGINDMLESSPQ